MITIISGGQTGVDEAALQVAQMLGYKTGGFMPQGYRREDGQGLFIAKAYSLLEHHSYAYQDRTRENVRGSDGTIILRFKANSPGEKCTLKAINELQKPFHIIDAAFYANNKYTCHKRFWEWVRQKNISTLNVAGNRDTSDNSILRKSLDIFFHIFNINSTEGLDVGVET